MHILPEPIAPLLDAWTLVMSYRAHLNSLAAINPDIIISVGLERNKIHFPTWDYDLPPFSAEEVPPEFRSPWCNGHYDGFQFLDPDPPSDPLLLAAYLNGYACGEAQTNGQEVSAPHSNSFLACPIFCSLD